MPEVTPWLWAAVPGAIAWLGVLLVPWRPWRTRERLEPALGANRAPEVGDLGDIVVLIPARDEAPTLPGTLAGLAAQGPGLKVVLVDDQSADDTAGIARRSWSGTLEIVPGLPLPAGWTGKVWAQHQGSEHLDRPLTLLLDADIRLAPGMLVAMRRHLRTDRRALVSLMATLETHGPWSRALLPAFVYFFKLLYPFHLVADPRSRVAAAAGGCVLVETGSLLAVGGFSALRGALIDDCALARLVKRHGHRIWLGLSRGVHSGRRDRGLGDIWEMVARTAYTQLGLRPRWLLACTAALLAVFVAPVAALVAGDPVSRVVAAVALVAMAISHGPVLRFYGLSVHRAWGLPAVGVCYLLMTWTSAWRHWRGQGAAWRGRRFASTA